jgi:hypothetical protein
MLLCEKCSNFYVGRAKSYHRGWCPECARKDMEKRDRKMAREMKLAVQGVQGVRTPVPPTLLCS